MNEKLIEEAASAIHSVAESGASWGDARMADKDQHRAEARAALSVFEKALGEATVTPTDDEREALLRDLYTLRGWREGNINRRIDIIDRAISALRRSDVPQGNPEICTERGHANCERQIIGGEWWTIHHPEPQGEPSEHRDRIALAEFIDKALDGDAGHGVGEFLAGSILSFLSERTALHAAFEPQGEPSDALNLVIHAERVGTERDDPLILELAEALRVALRRSEVPEPSTDSHVFVAPVAGTYEVTPSGLRLLTAEPQGEPSDAQVLAALNSYEAWSPEESLDMWGTDQVDRMRAALRAAWEVR